MKFIMTAESAPHSFDRWFDDFIEGLEFEAEDFDSAQAYLDSECCKAGTNEDLFWSYSPYAQESIKEI